MKYKLPEKVKVLKFGGSAFKNRDKMPMLWHAVLHEAMGGYKIIAVVSAMGSTTYKLKCALPGYLIPKPDKQAYDSYISTGEDQAAPLLSMYLIQNGIKAEDFRGWQAGIMTDDKFGDANIIRINTDYLSKFFQKNDVAVVSGFQGLTTKRKITTLGSNGSDLTAAYLADVFRAKSCVLYKDVSGIYTGDPKNSRPVLYKYITPDEVLQTMEREHSKIVQPKAVLHFKEMLEKGAETEIIVRNIDLSKKQFTTICNKTKLYRVK